MAVKDRVDDKLITAKLSFLSFVASLVEPFLKKYQFDKPMISFMYTDLKSLIQSLLELVVKQDVLRQCSNETIRSLQQRQSFEFEGHKSSIRCA